MQTSTLKAIVLIVACTLSVAAIAQKTYKCTDTYSQLPCPDGIVVNTNDQRTGAQKMQADLAARRDAKTADAMEKARLAQEKKDLAANLPPSKTSRPAASKKTVAKQITKKKKKEPEYFTAQVPGAKKKPSSVKKNMPKKEANPV